MELTRKLVPQFRVVANSVDATASIAERLISLEITDEAGLETDQLTITLTDNGILPLEIPDTGAEIQVSIGFDGQLSPMGLFVVDEVEIDGPPNQMVITAKAASFADTKFGKDSFRTQRSRKWKKGTTLGELVNKIAGEHGFIPVVQPELASVELPSVLQTDESDLNLLLSQARKYDAIVKPVMGRLVMTKRGSSRSATGRPLPQVQVWIDEVSGWKMRKSSSEEAGSVIAYWHRTRKGKRREVKAGSGEPVRRLKMTYPDEKTALAAALSEYNKRVRARVAVDLTGITGRVDIQAEAMLMPLGFRKGIDGPYLITSVRHSLTPTEGFITSLTAELPTDD